MLANDRLAGSPVSAKGIAVRAAPAVRVYGAAARL
jgi:hypothetical protein